MPLIHRQRKISVPDLLTQSFNNIRSLTLQTLDFASGYRRHLYYPFIVFPRHEIVFLAVPRSGSTSMEFALTPLLGSGMNFQSTRLKDHKFRHYMRSCNPREVATRYARFFKFTFVRNPWTRLYSCYLTRVRIKPNRYFRYFGLDRCRNFEDFVLRVCDIPDENADSHFISQSYLLTYNDRFLPDRVFRFESYADGFQESRRMIKEKTGISLLEMPHYHKTASRDYRNEYSTRLVDLVGKRYQADCDRFGYTYSG